MGFLLVAAIAMFSFWLVDGPIIDWGLSPLTVAILVGIAVGNSVYPVMARRSAYGVHIAKSLFLRAGIVLYGFHITLQEMVTVGWGGFLINLLMISCTFFLAIRLGRYLGLDRHTAMLIGAGSSICGAAAVLATDTVVRSQPGKTAVAVATVVVFGTISMLLYPLLHPYLGMTDVAFGIFAGSTIHEMAQVIGAGVAVSADATNAAVVEKMMRVMMLAPFLFLLGRGEAVMQEGDGRSEKPFIPWFALLFILVCLLNSTGILPSTWVEKLVAVDMALLAMAMAALGISTQFSAFREAGIRPILLAGGLFLFLIVGGYGINRSIGFLLG
ncbi:putative sulfate exporter family transporter [Alphaproteobacteria bacterium LMG 31809]|uniref:Sulfate exporter family transporter n=1 Tax=Govanella unica TaxID=2975056 RepID=A0A9X3U0X4_9PROT|nr:putative sulfate exporter family transporter [Govania unica]